MKYLAKPWQKTDKYLLAAFSIPTLLMLLLFIINGIYPFGGRSFLYMDMYHQYMPFFSEFVEKIKAGEGLAYSWNVGVGSNFLALYVYYLASPLHWLAFLFPKEHLLEFMSYLVIFKLGLCGLTSCIYLQKHFRVKSPVIVLISCFYAMSGFMAAYNWNIMWLDCVVLLPLIMLGLEMLVKEGKWVLYCVTLALSIYTNFYLSIMICIFLVLYFVVQWLLENRSLRAIRDFAMFSLLAGGLAAILLVPEVCAILETDFGDIDFPNKWEPYFDLLDVLARHCMLVPCHRQLDHWPNIFCGSAVLFMIPLYATNRGIPAKRRFAYLGLAGVILLGFSVNMLDFVWHGLNYPDSLPGRQSYIYIFLVLIMCTDAFLHMKEVSREKILQSYLLGVAFLLFCEKFAPEEYFTPLVMWITLIFMTVYAAIAYVYRGKLFEDVSEGQETPATDDQTTSDMGTAAKKGEKKSLQKALIFLLLLTVVLENGINTINTSLGTVSRSDYLGEIPDYQALYAQVREEQEGFFRVEKFERTTKNDGTLAGYPTASVFSSTLNSAVADMYEKLGMRHSKVYYGYDGATPLTSALLNVQYLFGKTENDAVYEANTAEDRLFSAIGSQGNLTLYKCNYSLPFGYVVQEDFDMSGSTGNPISVQNQMVKDLGVRGNLFTKKNAEQEDDDVKLVVEETGYYYMVVNSGGTSKVKVSSGNGSLTFNDLKKNCIIYAGYFEKGELVKFTNGDEEDESPKIKLNAYRLNTEVLKEALDILGAVHLENVEYDSRHICGNISLKEAGKMVLSVPYEHGWTVRVDGKKVETGLFGDCLMTISLTAGKHEITMDYVPYGQNVGIALSLVSAIGFLSCVCIWRKRSKKEKEILA